MEWFAVVVLALAFIRFTLIPAWRTLASEFPNYYLAAELYHQDTPLDRIYEWTWFQRQNDRLGVRDGLVSFAPNPPMSILAITPFTRLQPLIAKRVWVVLSLTFLAISLWVLRRVTTLGWRRLGLICLLCFLPLRTDFVFARPYVLILFLICLAYYYAHQGRHRTSGALWSAAAAMKLFPALAIVLFVRRRDWRALGGFVAGATSFALLSVYLFGVEVHRVFLSEVLSQAGRGDWLGPYELSQNSFTTLWSHLFLIEPELNPHPWINSPALYAFVLAASVTAILFCFVGAATNDDKSRSSVALQWAAFVPLMLLLSPTNAPDYWCLLIFSAIVSVDAFLSQGENRKALLLLLLYTVACARVPEKIMLWFPLSRLAATLALYLLLLAAAVPRALPARRLVAAGVIFWAGLAFYNLSALRNRNEDFENRVSLPVNGYRFANPVAVNDALAFTAMQAREYRAALLIHGSVHELALPGDILSLAGSPADNSLYVEAASRRSAILKLATDRMESAPEVLAEGQEPALSANGKWLAFVREEHGQASAFLLDTDSGKLQRILTENQKPLDLTVTDKGDVIAAAGEPSDPRLLLVRYGNSEVERLPVPDPARYPSISPDGKRLAFSRRDWGSWHLIVQELAAGSEQQLTHARCNAISPSWQDDRTLLYATDCGRGVGLSAIARVVLPE